jgi:hypothetical protein
MASLDNINQIPLTYWGYTKYTENDVNTICQSIDDKILAAKVVFDKGKISLTITKRTWVIQQGHYPTIMNFFRDISKNEITKDLSGSLIVWLEDGMWPWQPQLEFIKKVPILSFGRHIHDRYSFLIPDPAFLDDYGYLADKQEIAEIESKIKYEDKIETIFWRGAATGLGFIKDEWVQSPRGKLSLMANQINNPKILDAKISRTSDISKDCLEQLLEANVTGEAIPFADFLTYKFLVDADGHCCAWRSLFLKLLSNSVVFKIDSLYEQWYFNKLIPWKHFIPLTANLDNIIDCYNWAVSHPNEVQDIIRNAHLLTESITYQQEVENTAILCREIITNSYQSV